MYLHLSGITCYAHFCDLHEQKKVLSRQNDLSLKNHSATIEMACITDLFQLVLTKDPPETSSL